MRASHWLVLLRACSLLALGTSVALLLDYVSHDAHFCGADSGCSQIRGSGFGYIPLGGHFELPVPVLGILAFGMIYAASLQRSAEARQRVVTPLAYSVGLGAMGFIALQAGIGHFCVFCMVVDVLGIAIAGIAAWLSGRWDDVQSDEEARTTLMDPSELLSEGQRVRGVWRDDSQIYDAPNPLVKPIPDEPIRLKYWVWLSLAGFAVAAPLASPMLVKTQAVPASIRALYEPEGVTVVEFFDFQCPHCRDLSPRLKKLAQEEGATLRLKYVPLPNHEFAKDAARVSICAGEQGKEMEVATQIFSDVNLKLDHVVEKAKTVVDGKKLDECLASERPDQRIEKDIELIKSVNFEGLPTTYVGNTRVVGSYEDPEYIAAIRKAKAGADVGGMKPWAYWAMVAALVAAVILSGRVQPIDRTSIPG